MCRRLISLISLVVVLSMANGASGAEYNWTNNAPDNNSWCNQFNWDPNTGVPGANDIAVIRQPQRGPVVDCDVDVLKIDGPSNNQVMDVISGTLSTIGDWDCQDGSATINITGTPVVDIGGSWPQKNGTVTLTISGNPTITVGGTMKVANDSSDWFELYMSGGDMDVGGEFKWGEDGGGELNVSGGATLSCGKLFNEGRGGETWTVNLDEGTITVRGEFTAVADAAGSGNATINLDAGTLECGSFSHGTYAYAMDINEGMFIIDGDQVAAMNADVNAGYITAFDDTADVLVTYEGGKTIVKADYVQVKAWDPSPDNYARDVCPGVELSWQAGAYAVDHNVYFGPSLSDVNESADPCLDHYGETYWTPPGLELGTKYYWRVDGVDDANVDSPWVGDIWEFTTNDGNAFEPYPPDKETAVPRDVVLHWTPGCGATAHDVYFSTDFNDVNDRQAAAYLGEIVPNTIDPCAGLLDTTTVYYWVVDENDGATTRSGPVWSFRSISSISEPNRILWYKFDEDWGPVASDSSGYEHDGSGYRIDDQWEPNNGHIDGCLDFDADQHVAVPSDTLKTINKEITVSVWVKGDDDHADEQGKVFDTGDGSYYMRARIPTDEGHVLWRAGNDTNDSLVWEEASPLAWAEDWHFFAFVKDENAETMKIYFNGLVVKQKSDTINSLTYVKDTAFRIGADNDQMSDYTGKLDEFRVYDVALSDNEIAGLFLGSDIELAWGPTPFHGQMDLPPDVNMSWRPGAYAEKHDVYLGTDWDDVNDANTASAPVYRGRQDPCEYDPPASLVLNTTYYWRIDGVNTVDPNLWKGNVWKFTTANFIIIDDFEQYDNDTNMIYYTWIDFIGGSQIDLGTEPFDPAHGGDQSMLFTYDNTGFWGYYSEVELPFSPAKDFTNAGAIKVLTLYFYGDPGNDADDTEELYVGLGGSYAEVRYSDDHGNDNNDIKLAEWTEWNIPIPEFSDVDANSVTSLFIGFGARGSGTPGGQGVVFFDDIRLYPPRCRPEKRKPDADLNSDCIVSWGDVQVIGSQWLRHDLDLNPVDNPGDANLVGHWELEGNADDSSGNNYHGTAEGDYEWTAGKIGTGAIDLDGGWVVVEDDGNTPKLRPKDQVSATAWVYLEGGGNYRVVIKGENDEETFGLEVNGDDGLAFIFRDANNPGDVVGVTSGSTLPRDEWLHVGGTYDANEQTCYVNGVAKSSETRGALEIFSDANDGMAIGGRYGDTSQRFNGKIDDVRVYNRGLTRAEVAWLASQGTGEILLTSAANLYSGENPEVINLKDIAKLLEAWLVEKLWPE